MGNFTKEFYSFMRKIIIIFQIATIIILVYMSRTQAIPIEEEKYFLMTATAYYPGSECCAP